MYRANIALRRTLIFVILVNIHRLPLAQSAPIQDLALIHSKIYPSPTDSAIADGTILMRNGLILAVGSSKDIQIPPKTRIIDCKGMVVTAGFWNSHVHLLLPGLLHQEKVSSEQLTSQLNEMLTRWGFTTVFDIASELNNTNSIRDRITRGSVTGPRILTTGEPFWVKGGTPFYVRDFLLENNIHIPEVISLDEAENRVDSQIRNAADGIKIFINSLERDTILNMPLPMVKGISSRAHMFGKPVFAHVSTQMGIETALQGGVDIIA
ncbi:MAG TPA: hypothetical protein VGG71_06730, partial [Chitinophagaceae bacterium]